MLKPIPTRYSGTLFRSRAEARWAVLFDHFRIRWEYEREGYQPGNCWYLPDFWLRGWNCFAEVKGGTEQWDAEAMLKTQALARESRLPVLLLDEFKTLDWCVPVLAADTDGHVERSWCDMLRSIERERCWFDSLQDSIFKYRIRESDHPLGPSAYEDWQMDAQVEWLVAVERARNARFEHESAAA